MFGERLPDEVAVKFLLKAFAFEDLCRLEIADCQAQSVFLVESALWFEHGLATVEGYVFGPEFRSASFAEIKKLRACLRHVSLSEGMYSFDTPWRVEDLHCRFPQFIFIPDRKSAADLLIAINAAKEYSCSEEMTGHVQLILTMFFWDLVGSEWTNSDQFDEFLGDFEEDPAHTHGTQPVLSLWRTREEEQEYEGPGHESLVSFLDHTLCSFQQSEYVKFRWKGASVLAALGVREQSVEKSGIERKLQVIVEHHNAPNYWQQNIEVSVFGVGSHSVQARAVSASRGEQDIDVSCDDPRILPDGFLCVLCLHDAPGRMLAVPDQMQAA